jgi:hypothetical protein
MNYVYYSLKKSPYGIKSENSVSQKNTESQFGISLEGISKNTVNTDKLGTRLINS